MESFRNDADMLLEEYLIDNDQHGNLPSFTRRSKDSHDLNFHAERSWQVARKHQHTFRIAVMKSRNTGRKKAIMTS
jgi:hypothetical protein